MQIETPRPDGSLGPLYLASALEKDGHQVDILDASVGPEDGELNDTFNRTVMQESGLIRIGMTEEEIAQYIARGSYSVVGINSNFTPQTKMALEVARAAKSVARDTLVIAGGINARNFQSAFLMSGHVDAICLTEGEIIVKNIVAAWSCGNDISQVTGVAVPRGGRVVVNPVAPNDVFTQLDELPVPAWHKLPFGHYDRITSPHAVLSLGSERYAPIMTSRGCPFKCAYCHISVEKDKGLAVGGIGDLRLKSHERVIKEIETVTELGVKKVYFEDDSLLARKERVRKIFREVANHGLKIADVNGVNLIHLQKRGNYGLETDREYLELLCSAGFDQIVFPVESANQRILDKYATGKLHHDRMDVIELVRIAKDVGITCPVNMMIGFPDETEDEMMASIELGKRLVEAGSAYCTFFIPIPFPGSRLYEIAIAGGYMERDFNPDILNWKNSVMKNTEVPPERVLELRDWGWQYANTQEHTTARVKASIGTRWQEK